MVETVLKNITAMVVMATFVGCASLTKTDTTKNNIDGLSSDAQTARLTNDFSRSKLIAADFVATMTQFPSTNPSTTILHTDRPTTRFGELLLGALQSAGFDLRIGSESSDFWLNYAASLDKASSEAGNPVYTFVIAAGDVKLKRSYEVDQHGVWPAGNMFVRGADASNVVMDDSIFSIRKPPSRPIQQTPIDKPVTIAQVQANQPQANQLQATQIVQEPQLQDQTQQETVTVQAIPTPKTFVKTKKVIPAKKTDIKVQQDLTESVAAMKQSEAAIEPGTESVAVKSTGSYSEFSNMYENGESRYAEIFASYSLLDSKVLVFPNDSLVLGKLNKQSIRQQLSNFDPQTDIISVIGCSHGASNIENGNAYLANSRAFRVKEEYVSAGLDADKVLEEGCWAAETFAKMPDRGVVIQHKRLVN